MLFGPRAQQQTYIIYAAMSLDAGKSDFLITELPVTIGSRRSTSAWSVVFMILMYQKWFVKLKTRFFKRGYQITDGQNINKNNY